MQWYEELIHDLGLFGIGVFVYTLIKNNPYIWIPALAVGLAGFGYDVDRWCRKND